MPSIRHLVEATGASGKDLAAILQALVAVGVQTEAPPKRGFLESDFVKRSALLSVKQLGYLTAANQAAVSGEGLALSCALSASHVRYLHSIKPYTSPECIKKPVLLALQDRALAVLDPAGYFLSAAQDSAVRSGCKSTLSSCRMTYPDCA